MMAVWEIPSFRFVGQNVPYATGNNFLVFSIPTNGNELHFFLLIIFEVRKISTKRNFNCTNRKLSGALRTRLMSRTQRCPVRNVQNTGVWKIPETWMYPNFQHSPSLYLLFQSYWYDILPFRLVYLL